MTITGFTIPILAALGVTGGLIVFAEGWRVPLLALSAQYVLVGALLSQSAIRELALVKIVVGGVVCAILLITKQQWKIRGPLRALGQTAVLPRSLWQLDVREAAPIAEPEGESEGESSPTRSLMRRLLSLIWSILLLLTLALASITLTGVWQQRSPAPAPGTTGLAATWTMGVGLLTLTSRQRPFRIGLGLLTLVMGFEVAYTPLEPSLMMAGLLGALNIVVSLAIAAIDVAASPLQRRL